MSRKKNQKKLPKTRNCYVVQAINRGGAGQHADLRHEQDKHLARQPIPEEELDQDEDDCEEHD